VTRYNGYPAAELNGGPAPGVSSRQSLDSMAALAARELPPGTTYEWTDLSFQQVQAGNTALFIFPLCVLLVSSCSPPNTRAGRCRSPSF